ncbi:flagellar hook capping protein [Sporolactobacillus sp. THM7-7]|nr:flagellar hook capping protein [Sporolactobacillus sp. THM7-7]
MAASATIGAANTRTETKPGNILSKDDFLKLLVAQLTHQDPTSPLDSGQFVSQMADFTSLEQTQNMAAAIDKLAAAQDDRTIAGQAMMIGKAITWEETDKADGGTHTEQLHGTVSAVTFKDGKTQFITENGEKVDPETIIEVRGPNEDRGD